MSPAEILSILVVTVALPLNWIVAILLWRLSLATPQIAVLRERAIAATALSVIVTMFGLIFFNNDLRPPLLDFEATKLCTRGTLLAMATLPALAFLRLYRRSR